MENVNQLLRQGKKAEIWEKYCGFVDLGVDEFMRIQEELLAEQLKVLDKSELGRSLLGGQVPESVDEFRARVPFTTYDDYSAHFLERREDVLPEKPYTWVHTSGRSGEYKFKWIPYTRRMYDLIGENAVACFILASGDGRGDVPLEIGDKFIYTFAAPPYTSGMIMESLLRQFDFIVFPPFEESIRMDFHTRIRKGLQIALSEGIDYFYGITSIMIRISEQLAERDGSEEPGSQFLALIRKPKAFFRIMRAVIKAKLQKRPIIPSDLWKVKGVICTGSDTSIYKQKIKQLWGRIPFEVYGCTEMGIVAIQPFKAMGMIFHPYGNFLEFIPEGEYRKMNAQSGYTPTTLLLNELEAEKEYVVVGTNFHGGIMTRYITGDLLRVTSVGVKTADVDLPAVSFSTRADDVIDIGGFTRLTEKIVWQAIEDSQVEYVEWTIRKEYKDEKPILHLYIELKNDEDGHELEEKVHQKLKNIDEPYRELEKIAGIRPIKLTVLSKGTFNRYMEERQAAGVDLAQLKPPHINPPEEAVQRILRMSNWQL